MMPASEETRPYGRIVIDEAGEVVAFHVLPVVWIAGAAYARLREGEPLVRVACVGDGVVCNDFTWRPLKVCLSWGG